VLISTDLMHSARCYAIEILDRNQQCLPGSGNHSYQHQRTRYVEIDAVPLRCSVPIRCPSVGDQQKRANTSQLVNFSKHKSWEVKRLETQHLNGMTSKKGAHTSQLVKSSSHKSRETRLSKTTTSQWAVSHNMPIPSVSSNFHSTSPKI
jgi:hypothetical protein